LFQLSKDVFLFGGGQVFNRMVGFLLLPLFTSVLTPQDYGVSALISLVTALASGLFGLGTGVSVGRCYFDVQEPRERASVIWTAWTLLVANAGLLIGIVLLLSTVFSRTLFHSEQYSRHIELAFIALAITTAVDPINMFFRLTKRAGVFVILTGVNVLVSAGLSVFLIIILGHGLLGMFEACALSAAVYGVTVLLVGLKWVKPAFNIKYVWPLVKIGAPLIAPVVGWYVIEYVDRFLLERLVGLAEVGVYAVGFSFGSSILLLVNAFYGAWPGFFMPFVERRGEAALVFGRVLSYYVFGVGSICLLLFLAAKPVVFMMTAEPFHEAYKVVGLIAFAGLLRGCYLIFLPGLVFAKSTRLQASIELTAAALNVALNFALIPLLHKEGAAIAAVGAFTWMCVLAWKYSSRELSVLYEWRRLGMFMASVLILAALSFLQLPGLGVTVFAHTLYLVIFGVTTWYLVLTSSERASLIQLLLVQGRLVHVWR
jgi:O-antigen/teichoic acid export membrane protein